MNKINTHSILLRLVFTILFSALSGISHASENTFDLSLPSSKFYTQDTKFFLLTSNESGAVISQSGSATEKQAADFEPPLFSASKAHQYFGISTVVLAGLTALSHPEECGSNCSTNAPREVDGNHAKLAKATVTMAIATIASGLYAHWDDFHLEDGFSDPDNLHVLLGITGAALLAYAVNLSASSSAPVYHAGIAEAGALGMVVAIKLNW